MPPLYRDFTEAAQIDAEYNASLRVADPAAELHHYVEQAHQARETLESMLDVRYGPTVAETLDIFPADQPNAPVFIFVHGGYWRALSSKEFSGVALGLQPRGITTVVVNYALCPSVTIDEITRQVRAAAAWVFTQIADHGGDPTRVGIGGHSAGGHLTAMALQTRWDEDYGLPRDPFRAALPISGIYDIEPLRHSYLQPQIQLDDGIIRRNSPGLSVRPVKDTAIRVTWGGAETSEFARQARLYHEAGLAAGNRSTLEAVPGAHHYSAIHGFEHPHSPLVNWLARELGAPHPVG